ncbi:cytochrome P450 [Geopyxis carbonaria]|nr:cytochrome P450 [Geopyxis carbonaria]
MPSLTKWFTLTFKLLVLSLILIKIWPISPYTKGYFTDWRVAAVVSLVVTTACIHIDKTIRRIWFHPLSHIPGPKLAASTHLYLKYWHAIKKGYFVPYVLPKLHEQYGPVVRFSPTEVDVHDHQVYNTVYAPKSLYRKDWVFFSGFGCVRSSGMLRSHEEWRIRRNILSPMFSKKSINNATDRMIYPLIEKFCTLLEGYAESGKPVPFDTATYSITVDIITSYVSGQAWNMLDEPDFGSDKLDSVRWFTGGSNFSTMFPWARYLTIFLNKCFPQLLLEGYTQMYRKLVDDAVKEDARAKKSGDWKAGQKLYVFDALLNPDESKGYTRPPREDLIDETMLVIAGGGDTSANMIQFAVFTLCKNPAIRQKVLEDIDTLERNDKGYLDFNQVEGLAYLTGFIKEIFRMYHGAVGRQPRVVPKGGLMIASTGHFLPEGTRISCNILTYHMDPTVFTNPKEILPERWLGDAGKALQKWLLAFGKGDRVCLGKDLAYREMYLVIAELFSRFKIELYDTTDEDMKLVDHFASAPEGRLKVLLQKRQTKEMW